MWDTLGFECIVDITSYERAKLLHDIKGGNSDLKSPVSVYHLLIRAKATHNGFQRYGLLLLQEILQKNLY